MAFLTNGEKKLKKIAFHDFYVIANYACSNVFGIRIFELNTAEGNLH